MTHATLKVNPQGRVTIPAQMRREIGIQSDNELIAYTEDGMLTLATREKLIERIQSAVREARTATGSIVDELIAERREEAAREQKEMEEWANREFDSI